MSALAGGGRGPCEGLGAGFRAIRRGRDAAGTRPAGGPGRGGIGQPWRDLRKQLRKQQITPRGDHRGVRSGTGGRGRQHAADRRDRAAHRPGLSAGPAADLFGVVGLLFLGTVALTLAGLDTGTAFGGMGSSREITIAALVEPTILLAVFALSVPGQSANLAAIVSATAHNPGQLVSPGSVLAFVALSIVIIAETGRLPVDNPSTHLELTMIHEAMVLEYAGPKLALVEWASAMRLTVLLALMANLFATIKCRL